MKISFLDKLACPMDKTYPLTLSIVKKSDDGEQVIEGLLECPHCNRYYPIIYGIPIMNPDEYRDAALEAPALEKWKGQLGERILQGKGFMMAPDDEVKKLG